MRTNATNSGIGGINTGMLHNTKKPGPGMSSYHRKSQSLDAATISMQIGQTGSKTNNKSHHSLKER